MITQVKLVNHKFIETMLCTMLAVSTSDGAQCFSDIIPT